MRMRRQIDLLVFDWDGTLMNSRARIVASLQGAFADLGLEARSETALSDTIGLSLSQAAKRLYPGLESGIVASFVRAYRDHFLHRSAVPQALFPGTRQVLKDAHEAGYLLAVATSKSRLGLDRGLIATGLDALFHVTRCSDDAQPKPHPDMLEQIMATLGVNPVRTLMIGDTEYDLEMATRAGVRSLGATYGVHTSDRLERYAPFAMLDDIRSFPGVLATLAANSRA